MGTVSRRFFTPAPEVADDPGDFTRGVDFGPADPPKDFTVADALYMCRGQECTYAQIAQIEPDSSDCLEMQADLNPGRSERICGYAAQAVLIYGEPSEAK
jgi:hypothetical protein